MKKLAIFITLIIGLLVTSCERNDNPEYPFEAEVLGPNMDCGIYQIRIINDLDKAIEKVGISVVSGVYIAENLPVDLQKGGINIILDIREPKTSELGFCTAMGPSLTWLHVINAKLK